MIRKVNILTVLVIIASAAMAAVLPDIQPTNLTLTRGSGRLHLSADIILDSLKLKANQQVFMTPVVTAQDGSTAIFPTILVTGRGMHYAYERGTMRGLKEYRSAYDIGSEVRRLNNTPQTVEYSGAVPMLSWMRTQPLNVSFRYDMCGCGVLNGSCAGQGLDTILNPVSAMRVAYITPAVTDLPVSIHEGRARVQFEVNRTELHDSIYRCRNGQLLDNRQQLKVIYDSIASALTDPNVEIAGIEIIGYASPESPYEHNKELATGRSRALAEFISRYVGRKYNLSSVPADFDAVAENWEEFREQVMKANDISEQQRRALIEIIDRPAFSPSDYDAKESQLNSDPLLKDLYRNRILPQWFPHLRATKFRINTRLKPMEDARLAEIILTAPEKMSLNQMMRVARLYPEGTEEFDRVIRTALEYYPDSEEANLNAAVSAIRRGNFDEASRLLDKSGNSTETKNARAIILVNEGNLDEARKLLEDVRQLPEAQKNLMLLENE